ncbi:MAG: bifunctional diaminohydroxyphosphoribosylaminopyrimidine deaminase/5-amino-6-(5-phosphoribosylamino)uracil reductase RibD, partial [Hyphomicrobiales bacterium]
MSAGDERFMRIALSLGRRNLGHTGENPSVGCVIVAGEGARAHVVGRGWTAPGGRPHAETLALGRAGALAAGATAYVTLEPCAHHGKTPPCAEALADAGIARAVVATGDPDARVAGRGIEQLRAAGITVDACVLADQARRDLAGFLSRIERGRPEVTLKLAVSADGKIAAAPGKTTAITGAQARSRGHLIRAQSDAILVGRGTVVADDPSLTCRLPGMEDRSP